MSERKAWTIEVRIATPDGKYAASECIEVTHAAMMAAPGLGAILASIREHIARLAKPQSA